ncbi:MAG: hypothetical protein IJ480_01800 [Clostridia bacterium]|nr:hypothetical protein [Clostridia bacterium]
MKNYIIEAHRGVGTDCPEETMSAFRAAVEQGYGMIELDTKFTADNRCVLLHDRTVNRTGRMADGSAIAENTPIAEMTLAQALELDFGIWKGPEFAGEKIPTLEQVLAFAMENQIPLKFDNVLWSHTPEQQQIFFDTIISMGAQNIAEFTSGSIEGIRKTLSRLPEANIHYDGPVTPEAMIQVAGIVPKEQLTTWTRFDNRGTSWCKNPPVTAENAALVKQYGKLGVWLLTEQEELEQAVHLYDADIIETDGRLKP